MASAPKLARSTSESDALAQFSSDVVVGLSQPGQKELPSKYLYDAIGSALFEVITLLPEYGLTRAETRLMQKHAAEIAEHLPTPVVVAELGSGSGQKTRWLLEALARRQRVHYYPIDISGSALFRCQQELGQIDMVSMVGFESAYLDGLREAAARHPNDRLLVLFLGSTIGNFDRPAAAAFLGQVRAILRAGDMLLLATDLEKPLPVLTRAYDDFAGVTAAFNKNILARINRELDADFDLQHFRHVARYDSSERRVEMHLLSNAWQRIAIRKAGFHFHIREGETIWTESSHKYDSGEVIRMGARAGFQSSGQWTDEDWPFAQTLFTAA